MLIRANRALEPYLKQIVNFEVMVQRKLIIVM